MVEVTSATSGRTPVHTDCLSLLLMLLFIFFKIRNRECWSHDRTSPSPSSQGKRIRPNSLLWTPLPALVGLDSRGV